MGFKTTMLCSPEHVRLGFKPAYLPWTTVFPRRLYYGLVSWLQPAPWGPTSLLCHRQLQKGTVLHLRFFPVGGWCLLWTGTPSTCPFDLPPNGVVRGHAWTEAPSPQEAKFFWGSERWPGWLRDHSAGVWGEARLIVGPCRPGAGFEGHPKNVMGN